MIFTSTEFFVLLATTVLLLSLTPTESRRRNILLVSSYVFYGWWDWRFCFLILASTILDFIAGRQMGSARTSHSRRAWLVLSLCANLGMLGYFKYANFFLDSFGRILEPLDWDTRHLDIILPVGISFFTFQTMSYSIDVYRRKLPVCENFRDFALFVSFFPQLVAGPIVRGSDFLPQLSELHPVRRSNILEGLGMFVRGFVKKALFADTLSVIVDPVFATPELFSSATCWLAVIAYSGQIYYDFSGYSDMAIGVGRILGFSLPENFRHPYRSLNIAEFWRRWHISLSGWLRDYLYIPLGGNRHGSIRTYRNLMITMLLGGLWHGASWNFVIWGGLHGGALALHKVSPPLSWKGMPKSFRVVLGWFLTYTFVLVTWVFFRSADISTSTLFLRRMFFDHSPGTDWFYVQAMVIIGIGFLLHLVNIARQERETVAQLNSPIGFVTAMGLLGLVLLFAPFGNSPFIYFQF